MGFYNILHLHLSFAQGRGVRNALCRNARLSCRGDPPQEKSVSSPSTKKKFSIFFLFFFFFQNVQFCFVGCWGIRLVANYLPPNTSFPPPPLPPPMENRPGNPDWPDRWSGTAYNNVPRQKETLLTFYVLPTRDPMPVFFILPTKLLKDFRFFLSSLLSSIALMEFLAAVWGEGLLLLKLCHIKRYEMLLVRMKLTVMPF